MTQLANLFLALLPTAVLAAWILLAFDGRTADAVVRGAVAWAATAYAMAELLGAFHLLTRPAVLAAWCAIALATAWHSRRRLPRLRAAFPAFLPRRAWTIPILALLALALLEMALYPPNSFDSLVYHLPRVEHWIANRSLAFYPTCIDRQLFSQPLAEVLLLHFRILAGSDRLLGFVQWLAYAGCITLAYGQARLLGCSVRGRALAAIFAATIPMAVLQSSTTQNDLVAAFWILAAAFQLTRSLRDFAAREAPLFGAAAGLACLAKGTAYPLVLPMAAVFAATSLWHWRTRLAPAIAAGCIFLALNTPHWARCRAEFGDIFGGQTQSFRPPATPSALVVESWFHVSLHFAPLPESANRALDGASARLLRALGVDEHSKAHFFCGASPIQTRRFAIHQDFCPNPFHALLLLAAIPAALAARRKGLRAYALLFLAAGATFLLCVSWQPWLTRLQTPFFCLGAAPTGAMLEALAARRRAGRIAAGAVAALLVAQSAIPALFSYDRALVPSKWTNTCNVRTSPREHRYFAACKTLCLTYTSRADAIAALRPKVVGFTGTGGDCEYLLWMLLRNRMGKEMPAIVYAGDDAPPPDPPPDVILSLTQGRHRRPTLLVPGAEPAAIP